MDITDYICKICGEQFSEVDIMKLHIEFMHEEEGYCPHCDYKATLKGNLKIHIESKHNKIKYPCQQCAHKASTKQSLKLHIQSIHDKIKYSCEKCEYKATTTSRLQHHIKKKQ